MPTDQKAPRVKLELRVEMSRRLRRLDPELAGRQAHRVQEQLFELPEMRGARGVLTCLSFGREIDTSGIVARLENEGRRVYVPRAERRDFQLHVHPYPCRLRTLPIGLRQPLRGSPEIAADDIDRTIDVALVLGLAFDQSGHRLGYGHGYFDRFLAGRSFPTIGLAYGFQLLDEIPHEPHDVPLTVVVTEDGVFRP